MWQQPAGPYRDNIATLNEIQPQPMHAIGIELVRRQRRRMAENPFSDAYVRPALIHPCILLILSNRFLASYLPSLRPSSGFTPRRGPCTVIQV